MTQELTLKKDLIKKILLQIVMGLRNTGYEKALTLAVCDITAINFISLPDDKVLESVIKKFYISDEEMNSEDDVAMRTMMSKLFIDLNFILKMENLYDDSMRFMAESIFFNSKFGTSNSEELRLPGEGTVYDNLKVRVPNSENINDKKLYNLIKENRLLPIFLIYIYSTDADFQKTLLTGKL